MRVVLIFLWPEADGHHQAVNEEDVPKNYFTIDYRCGKEAEDCHSGTYVRNTQLLNLISLNCLHEQLIIITDCEDKSCENQ